jgi:hypothetical protein
MPFGPIAGAVRGDEQWAGRARALGYGNDGVVISGDGEHGERLWYVIAADRRLPRRRTRESRPGGERQQP